MHVNNVYVVYVKRYGIILLDVFILYTYNMNFVGRFDYFDVWYNRQTSKQTNRQTQKSNLTLLQNNQKFYVHTRTDTHENTQPRLWGLGNSED